MQLFSRLVLLHIVSKLKKKRIFDFFSVLSISVSPNEHQKQYFHEAKSENTTLVFRSWFRENTVFGVHSVKKNRYYTEKVKYSLFF